MYVPGKGRGRTHQPSILLVTYCIYFFLLSSLLFSFLFFSSLLFSFTSSLFLLVRNELAISRGTLPWGTYHESIFIKQAVSATDWYLIFSCLFLSFPFLPCLQRNIYWQLRIGMSLKKSGKSTINEGIVQHHWFLAQCTLLSVWHPSLLPSYPCLSPFCSPILLVLAKEARLTFYSLRFSSAILPLTDALSMVAHEGRSPSCPWTHCQACVVADIHGKGGGARRRYDDTHNAPSIAKNIQTHPAATFCHIPNDMIWYDIRRKKERKGSNEYL